MEQKKKVVTDEDLRVLAEAGRKAWQALSTAEFGIGDWALTIAPMNSPGTGKGTLEILRRAAQLAGMFDEGGISWDTILDKRKTSAAYSKEQRNPQQSYTVHAKLRTVKNRHTLIMNNKKLTAEGAKKIASENRTKRSKDKNRTVSYLAWGLSIMHSAESYHDDRGTPADEQKECLDNVDEAIEVLERLRGKILGK